MTKKKGRKMPENCVFRGKKENRQENSTAVMEKRGKREGGRRKQHFRGKGQKAAKDSRN